MSGRADVAVSCGTCGIDFDHRDSRPEASYFARTHNELHHSGRLAAIVTVVEPARRKAAIEAAAASHGEQGREQAAEDIDQGQGERWLRDDDADEAGW